MRCSSVRSIALVTSVLFAGAAALADPSAAKPAAPPAEPGVEAYNAGVKLMKQGRFAEAAARFEAALAENDRMAEAHNNLGYSLRKQGPEHYDTALAHYDRAIELAPKLAEAYAYRGVLYVLLGHKDKALADHATLVGLNGELAGELEASIASGREPAGLRGASKGW